MKSMLVSKYFEVVNPEYMFIKITPLKSLRNYKSDKIINTIAIMYRSLTRRIIKENKKYFFNVPVKVSYYIYMEKDEISFYFVVPKTYYRLLKDKISDTWKGITMEIVEKVPFPAGSQCAYSLGYQKEDAFSLAGDKRNNVLLSSLLSNTKLMEHGDSVAVLYNFIPTGQRHWRAGYDNTLDKFHKGFPVLKEKQNASYVMKLLFKIILVAGDIIIGSINELTGTSAKKAQLSIAKNELIPETYKKRDSRVIKTQIVVVSKSNNALNANNNAMSLCEAFRTVSGDNELIPHRISPKFDVTDYKIKGADVLETAPYEGQNFISLPGRELIEEHHIESIETFEEDVPKELQSGSICVGTNIYRGKSTKAYLTTDKEYGNLSLAIIGPTRAGKTTLISNIARDTLNAGECTILLDFCGNCDLSDDVSKCVDRVLDINFEDSSMLQGLGYNEVNPHEPDAFKRYRNAKMQCVQLQTLIDSISDGSADLTARMNRYLEAASMVVFINGGSIKMVFDCLQNSDTRAALISRIPEQQKDNLEEYVSALRELNDEKNGGSKLNLVTGIFDRVQKLKQNAYMEMMLSKDCSENFNLLDEIQKSQLICLRMPDSMFSTESEKDVYCTYWVTKIWLALQLRKRDVPRNKQIRVNIVVDELYQVPKCQEFIKSKLSQMAKFSGKMIISCHYLRQIDNIRDELKSANSSYMLLAGSDKENYKELKDELAPFVLEDLLSLKRYHSLNLLKITNGYARFITKLPPPVTKGD